MSSRLAGMMAAATYFSFREFASGLFISARNLCPKPLIAFPASVAYGGEMKFGIAAILPTS